MVDYNDVFNQPREYFFIQYKHFRKIIGDSRYDLDRMDAEYEELAKAYFRCKMEQRDIELFKVISDEWERRRMYMVMNGYGRKEVEVEDEEE